MSLTCGKRSVRVANDDAECSRPEEIDLLPLMFPPADVSLRDSGISTHRSYVPQNVRMSEEIRTIVGTIRTGSQCYVGFMRPKEWLLR